MADGVDVAELVPIDNIDPEETPGYVAPAVKSLDEIQKLDQDDESLVRYKQMLLAGSEAGTAPAGDQRRVIVQNMALVVEGRPDIILDLEGDISTLKGKPIVVKEGTTYKLRITFKVQHEIVSGLKYHHVVSRKGVKVDKLSLMVGSYGPKVESHVYFTPPEEAPHGFMYRGRYVIASKFLDDDKNYHLQWEWALDIKKDWE